MGGVLIMKHPNTFLEQRIANGKAPNGHSSVQPETFDIHITLGFNCSTGPAIGSECIIRSVITNRFVELGYKLHAANRRPESRYQQAMIATGKIATHGARSESSDAVSDQPLALFRDVEHSADFAAQYYFRILGDARLCGRALRNRSRLFRCHPLIASV